MVALTENALRILERRYLRRDEGGKIVETPEEMFRRVAENIASGDALYGASAGEAGKTAQEFHVAMSRLEFLPNSPTLINAGRVLQQLAACFVLPVDDSIAGIFEAIKQAAQIHKSGGGTGFSFSRLRPKGDMVASSHGVASGPVSFIRVFDAMTETISQGGVRRGANMAILSVGHPDILDFIRAKSDVEQLRNFNISVAVTEDFLRRAEKGEEYDLVNPRSGAVVKRLNARKVMDLIIESAWATGEPGVVFLDRINRDNPTPEVGEIEATNPCGEQPLLAYESCNLGSINLAMMAKDGQSEGERGAPQGAPSAPLRIDFEKLRRTVRTGVHFLDNVVDMNRYPLAEIQRITQANRKIGLGVMGFADLLIRLGVPYDSPEGVALGEKIMGFIADEARAMSQEIARARGPFPNFPRSVFARRGEPPRRNATLTTVAPTGTISIIAGCSGGIEPIFAICYVRNAFRGERMLEVNPVFEKTARERGFHTRSAKPSGDRLMAEIARRGSVRGMPEVPEDVQRVFATAYDIAPEWHVRMQAAFQATVDNAVSKTINFPATATKDDVRKAFWMAYTCGCKGITVYRDRSRREQVLTAGLQGDADRRDPTAPAASEGAPLAPQGTLGAPLRHPNRDRCPECGNAMSPELACRVCRYCGHYRCG